MNLFAATKALVGGRTALAGAAGLGALFAAALFLGPSGPGLPHRPARTGAASMAAAAPGLYFHGSEGALLDFAPAGPRRP